MTDRPRWWFADLVAAFGLTVGSAGFLWGGLGGWPRVVLALPLVLFLPGYALVSAVFPRAGETPTGMPTFDDDTSRQAPSTAAEPGHLGRIVLSVVASVAVVPMAVLVLDVSSYPIRPEPVLLTVAVTTVGLLAVATLRRLRVVPANRYEFDASALPRLHYSDADTHRFSRSKWDARLPNLVLAVGALLLLSSVGYAAVNQPTGPAYTEFRVETENMTADSQSLYPATLSGESTVETVVTNHEGESADYTVVAVMQASEGGESSVVGRASQTVAAGDQTRIPVTIQPSGSGDRRLVLLLYRGDAPQNPSAESAYRTLRLQVSVGGGSAGSG
ncbi:DUF1616 domain-containing protein [Halobacteriales archaeon Cl-PHB]